MPLSGEQAEIALALLPDLGFESFEEEDRTLHAFIPEKQFDREALCETLASLGWPADFETSLIAPRNWNAEWEQNYPPVEVDDFVQVIPSFRTPRPGFEHTLFIEPKMSFGTGHHHTTRLVMKWCRGVNFTGLRVLDMGCGTGILGLLAARLGAASIHAVDNDPWCVENSTENAGLNAVENMEISLGGAEILPEAEFDVIMANINRNVLLQDGEKYCRALKPGGLLALSGFFDLDESRVSLHFTQLGMESTARMEENGWVLLGFRLHKH